LAKNQQVVTLNQERFVGANGLMVFFPIFTAEFLPPTFKDKVKHKSNFFSIFVSFCLSSGQYAPALWVAKLESQPLKIYRLIVSFKALIKFKSHLYFEEKDLVDKAEKVTVTVNSLLF